MWETARVIDAPARSTFPLDESELFGRRHADDLTNRRVPFVSTLLATALGPALQDNVLSYVLEHFLVSAEGSIGTIPPGFVTGALSVAVHTGQGSERPYFILKDFACSIINFGVSAPRLFQVSN